MPELENEVVAPLTTWLPSHAKLSMQLQLTHALFVHASLPFFFSALLPHDGIAQFLRVFATELAILCALPLL